MARKARALGLDVMVGNMIGTASRWRRRSCSGSSATSSISTARSSSQRPLAPCVYENGTVWSAATTSGVPGAPFAARRARKKTWFGQPRGLTILFLTEMWEIFSYFGMRALLVYYMTKQLAIAQQNASLIYGAYNAFVYFTPIVGGIISDRWLGRRNSVLLGGSIMALGHFMMAFEPLFFVALATIGIGNGLFLPALPSQISGLYSHDDPRRKTAYNYYYLGVNVGGFLAPLVCGTVGEVFGWHWGFTLAGFGMVSGLVIYVLGGSYLPPEPPRALPAPSPVKQHAHGSGMARRFALLAGICGMVVIFRTAYEQVGNTLPLWIEHVDRSVGASVIPMTWFQSLNPLLVLLTPLVLLLWRRRADAGAETIRRFARWRSAPSASRSRLPAAGAVAPRSGRRARAKAGSGWSCSSW